MRLFREPVFADKVLRNIPDIFFVKDAECRIVLGNPAFFSLYPESMHDRIIGYTTAEEYDEAQANAFLANDRMALEQGASEVLEVIDRPSGGRITLFTRKIRFEDEKGDRYILGIARDVTEILAGQNALKESEARYALAAEGAAVGIWDWNIVADEILWSGQALSLLGADRTEEFRHFDAFMERVHADDLPTLNEAVEQHLQDQIPFDVEYRIRDSEGRYIWVHARGQAKWDADGNPTRMAGSIEDVTDRKHAQLKLEQQNQQLNEFAHIASHDLKAPLRGMCSHIEMLHEDFGDQLDDEVLGRLGRMQELTERMESLIVDLLKIAKAVEGEKYLVDIDMNSLVSSAIALIPDADDAAIEIAELPTINCEPVAVRELLRNLVANGLKYNTSASKQLDIGIADAEMSGRHCNAPVFFVRDNGIGIADSYHESIFKIFRRLHGRDEFGGGTGAGLTFVERIVHRHGGEIWLKSAPDQGTTFFFTLSA